MNRNTALKEPEDLKSLNSSFDRSDCGIPLRGNDLEDSDEENQPFFAKTCRKRASILSFKELKLQKIQTQIGKIHREIYFDLVTILFLISALVYEGENVKCGVKIVTWNSVLVVALFLRVTISSTRMFFFKHFPEMGSTYSLASFMFIDLFLLTWLCYGIELFTQKSNRCDEKAPYLYTLNLAIIGLNLI